MEIIAQEPQIKTKARGKTNLRGFFTKRRKMLLLVGMFALLIVTGYLNFSLNNRTPEVGGGTQQQSIFEMFRQTRHTERQSQIAILENIVASSSHSDAAKRQAEEQKLALLSNINFENTAEGWIAAAGYKDVVVSRNGANINVLVRQEATLTREDIGKIQLILNDVEGTPIQIQRIFISQID